MKMRGAILLNPFDRRDFILNQAARLGDELASLGASYEVVTNNFVAGVEDGKIRSKLLGLDFCVYLDKDKYTALMLEKWGLRLFNRATASMLCDDKMLTAIALADEGIPMPETFAAPLCYFDGMSHESVADEAEKKLGFPMIVKAVNGSLGKEVFKADTREELIEIISRLGKAAHIFQRFVAESSGRDMRVIVVGGKVAAAMTRESDGDFRSNLSVGGRGTAVVPPREVADMCERAAKVLGLDYCGVDVLFGREGYLVCEVNSNAFFRGIERVTGVNVAGLYAKHIVGTVEAEKGKK